jgi:hypothetical protein
VHAVSQRSTRADRGYPSTNCRGKPHTVFRSSEVVPYTPAFRFALRLGAQKLLIDSSRFFTPAASKQAPKTFTNADAGPVDAGCLREELEALCVPRRAVRLTDVYDLENCPQVLAYGCLSCSLPRRRRTLAIGHGAAPPHALLHLQLIVQRQRVPVLRKRACSF